MPDENIVSIFVSYPWDSITVIIYLLQTIWERMQKDEETFTKCLQKAM